MRRDVFPLGATLLAVATLTITVDEAVLKRARMRALERGESVNKVLARSVEDYAGGDDGFDPLGHEGDPCREAPVLGRLMRAHEDRRRRRS